MTLRARRWFFWLIQYHLANRVFTVHDVVVNGLSSVVVLLFLRVHLAPALSARPDLSS